MVDEGVSVITDEMVGWAEATSAQPEGNMLDAQLLLELLRDHVGVSELGELTVPALRQLLLEAYPRKVTVLDDDDLAGVLPTARDLVRFAEETGRMDADRAAALTKAVDGIEPEFADTVMDPDNWGMARSITQAMAADGVDPSNSVDVDRWISASNSKLARVAPADEPVDPRRDLAGKLGLPERLPPLRLPPELELAGAARASLLLSRAGQLAAWAGDMRETEDGELTALDAVAAAQAVGIPLPDVKEPDGVLPDMPAKPPINAMRDMPELLHLWGLTAEAGLIELCEGHVHVDFDPADLSDDHDALGAWEGAFGYVVGSWLPTDAEIHRQRTLSFEPAGFIVSTTLFLAREPFDVAELRTIVREVVVATAPPAKARKAWKSWTKAHGDPVDTLLARLAELGAVTVEDGTAELTALGMMAVREMLQELAVDVPLLPPPDEMTAADLVAAAAGLSPEELDVEVAAWLDQRDPVSAADELLAIAAKGHPAERLAATSIAASLGPAIEPRWRAALDQVELRPYAKIALANIAGGDAPGGQLPGAEQELSDSAWLLTDVVMATVDEDDHDAVVEQFRQAVPAGREPDMFDALWRLPHPDAHEVLATLGRIHPDKKIAKQARKAAFKARDATPRPSGASSE